MAEELVYFEELVCLHSEVVNRISLKAVNTREYTTNSSRILNFITTVPASSLLSGSGLYKGTYFQTFDLDRDLGTALWCTYCEDFISCVNATQGQVT